ncbi:YlbF family regulator [Alicyclobacillus acidiphilus]|uniref:YlbF family regulator n=1 Tax=Alicyclobacillus acidiphilus TaxID=182455 RepID=UPI00083265FD|nr:YlbF family regulator [Alicyclobacillus acidiphilus]
MDRTELLLRAGELADLILDSPEAYAYQRADAELQAHPEAVNLLRRFRELREQVAEFQARRVPPMHYHYLLEETDKILQQLEGMPVVKAFEDAQASLNTLLEEVTARLANAVEKRS